MLQQTEQLKVTEPVTVWFVVVSRRPCLIQQRSLVVAKLSFDRRRLLSLTPDLVKLLEPGVLHTGAAQHVTDVVGARVEPALLHHPARGTRMHAPADVDLPTPGDDLAQLGRDGGDRLDVLPQGARRRQGAEPFQDHPRQLRGNVAVPVALNRRIVYLLGQFSRARGSLLFY